MTSVLPNLIRIEAPAAWEGEPPDTHPGRALNAWLYGRIAEASPEVADAVHAERAAKPFTIAIAETREGLRLCVSACGPLASHVATMLDGTSRILLDGRWLDLQGEANVQAEDWGALASRWLITADRPVPVRLEFLSPTTFHSRGRTLPLPVPELVFGGLLQRWQQWSTVDLGEGAGAAITEHAVIRRHRTWTQWIRMEGSHSAFVGAAEFTLAKPPAHFAGLAALLGCFAEYAGVGQKVGMGLGCVRATPLPPRSTS